MSLFDKLKGIIKKEDESSPAFRRKMCEKLDGRAIRYVTERIDNKELVIGRSGHINIVNDTEFAVTCGADTLFRADIDALQAWELLSLDGVVLNGLDKTTGRERSVVAHYVYYR